MFTQRAAINWINHFQTNRRGVTEISKRKIESSNWRSIPYQRNIHWIKRKREGGREGERDYSLNRLIKSWHLPDLSKRHFQWRFLGRTWRFYLIGLSLIAFIIRWLRLAGILPSILFPPPTRPAVIQRCHSRASSADRCLDSNRKTDLISMIKTFLIRSDGIVPRSFINTLPISREKKIKRWKERKKERKEGRKK